jgi:hypothetical protein
VSIKNHNNPRNIIYPFIGTILGIVISFGGATLIEYIGRILHKSLVQEFSMIFWIFATPTLITVGIAMGINYARKYKK